MTQNSRQIVPVLFLMVGFVLGVIFSTRIAAVLTIDHTGPRQISSAIQRESYWKCVVTTQFKFPTKRKSSLLTLFTTLPNWSWKRHVFNNTLYNWRLLFPLNVTAVLFTNNFTVAQSAWDLNWTVLPITASLPGEDGPPILPTMFKQARDTIASEMYGFVNGDILFDDSIVDTVKIVLNSTLLTARNSPPVMITGRRINVHNITPLEALSWKSLRKRSKASGKLFMLGSEDYFITNRDYPWDKYPPIAIGQRAYDNWLVLRGNQLSHNLVDGSRNVLAVHQSTKDHIPIKKIKPLFDYNADLLQNRYGVIEYNSGQTSCCPFETFVNRSGFTVLRRRVKLPKFCRVKKANHLSTTCEVFHSICN